MLTTSCDSCKQRLQFEEHVAGQYGKCPKCGSEQYLMPVSVRRLCGHVHETFISYCRRFESLCGEIDLEYKQSMNLELGAYLLFVVDFAMHRSSQSAIARSLVGKLAQSAVVPFEEDRFNTAISHRLKLYAECGNRAKEFGDLVTCCHARLTNYLHQSPDSVRDVLTEDLPLAIGDAFDAHSLRAGLVDLELDIVVPLMKTLSYLFRNTSDLLTEDIGLIDYCIEASRRDA